MSSDRRPPRRALVLIVVLALGAWAFRQATKDRGGTFDPERPEASR